MRVAVLIFFITLVAVAQTNPVTGGAASNSPAGSFQAASQRAEKIRADCIAGRRLVCGKILKVLPDGLVVDSGYTDLLRPALRASWLIPGGVTASRPANVVESRQPESTCVGVVFLTDLPKIRGAAARPKPYDYIVLMSYPAGQSTYTSVGTVQKTVRHFSANLTKAVSLNFAGAEKSEAPLPAK